MKNTKTIYINAPFKPSTYKRIEHIAKRNERAMGRQVAWIVERFFAEKI